MRYYENFKKHSTYDFALNGKERFDSNVTLILRYQMRVFLLICLCMYFVILGNGFTSTREMSDPCHML